MQQRSYTLIRHALIVVCALFANNTLAMPRQHWRLVMADLDPPWWSGSFSGQRPNCQPNTNCGNERISGRGFSYGLSWHFPLLRFLSLSAAPFVEGAILHSTDFPDKQIHPILAAGVEFWWWPFGTRFMIGPSFGAAYFNGAALPSAGAGFSWCLSCSVPEGAGAFRKSLDRVVFRRIGAFKSGDSLGVERFEMGLVFKAKSR
jgi:hypothetical protein